jgi:serine/threonine protein kinase
LIARDEFGRQQPKLLDFGIAKVDQTLANEDRKLTQEGVALGSPEYMSPEQASGREDIDHRSDVWALCVVLYESITGKMPFDRPNYNALMQAIIHDGALPTTDFSAGDPDLWRVIERGLQKNPENRWSSMTELGEALALWLYEHGVKEDISANSLRAVWLDGSLSGVRMDLGSMMPLRSSRPPAGDSGAQMADATKRLKPTGRSSLREQQSAPTISRRSIAASAPARRWVWAVGVGAALALGLGAGLLFRGGRAQAPSPVSSAVSVPKAVVTALPVSVEQPANPVPAAALSAVAAPAASHAHATPSAARAGLAPHPHSNGKHYDFGF